MNKSFEMNNFEWLKIQLMDNWTECLIDVWVPLRISELIIIILFI